MNSCTEQALAGMRSKARCDAQVQGNASCAPPSLVVQITGASDEAAPRLRAALEKNLPERRPLRRARGARWLDVTGGGELADMCVDFLGLNQDHASDGDFTVQRIWSNSRAAAVQDPCVPVLTGAVYFNAAPRQSFFILPVGGSATFDVDAFSFAPTSNWTLIPQDWSDSTTTYLSFSIEGGTGTQAGPTIQVHDGAAVRVTVTLTQDPGSLDVGEADGALVSFLGDPSAPTAAHFWPFAVMSEADATDAGIPAPASAARTVQRVTGTGGGGDWAAGSAGTDRGAQGKERRVANLPRRVTALARN